MPRPRLALAVPLLMIALAGCDKVDSASNSLANAEVCAKAVAAAGYTPDLTNPTKSAQDARNRADQLRGLADRTADADLQRQLRAMADQLGSLHADDVSPSAVATWTSRKATQLDQLRRACS
jgi:hypothetical protein